VHPRSPQRLFTEKEARRPGPFADDRVRRAAPLPWWRRPAEIVRFHLPKVPAVPQRDRSLTHAVTHKFLRRGLFSGTRAEPFTPKTKKPACFPGFDKSLRLLIWNSSTRWKHNTLKRGHCSR